MSCDRASDFIISTLPNSVRSRALQRSRFVCSFFNLWLKLCWLFPFSSYETWIPKILTGLRSHFNCNGLLLLFSHFPNQIAFDFSGLILGQLANQSSQLFLKPFHGGQVSTKKIRIICILAQSQFVS